ncbi:MAG: type I-E CRISPR-associated protein Cas6/Cse3/CasE [Burkholderiales bacterium]|nr:type I-E CRISPR-associated protein Cas6/Cse3/CasE [Burkholderiales bacterium]
MSHFFSRARIVQEGLNRGELLRLAGGDAYFDHALVWRLFPGDGAARDFVFRAIRNGAGWPEFFVVSQREPAPVLGLLMVETKLYEPKLGAGDRVQFSLRANPTQVSVQTIPEDALASYNAKRSMIGKPSQGRRRKRIFHDVLMDAKKRMGHPLPIIAPRAERDACEKSADEAVRNWFLQRAQKWGLSICQRENLSSTLPEPTLDWSGYRQHRPLHRGRAIQFSSVDYEGYAEVIDPDKLTKALTTGIGRAKAFGCGLLLVRRLTD